ncbi:MAG: glyoxalase [Paenibacillaceae bacterium]|jgi:predicted transcriptional regulator YdeE|nr:glyoxalase [Paenibacillaceae bacterium]
MIVQEQFQTSTASEPFVAAAYMSITVSDLREALAWYGQALRFKVLAYNPKFATLEMAPGRLAFVNRSEELSGSSCIGLHVPDTEGLHRHLTAIGAEVGPLMDGIGGMKHFDFQDPYGNKFGVVGGFFGQNRIEYVIDPSVARFKRFTMAKQPSLRIWGVPTNITVDNPNDSLEDAGRRAEKSLQAAGVSRGPLLCVNPVLERYADVGEHSIIVGAVVDSESQVVPDGLVELVIPEQFYAVFHFESSRSDFRVEYSQLYRWLGKQFGFQKPAIGSAYAYHLEMNGSDGFEAWIPYHTGPDIQHSYD